MKARVGRGRGAAGLMRYLMDEGQKATGLKNPEIVGGTLTGTRAAQLTRELTAVRALRPDVKRHLWHTSLALPPGEKLSTEKWDTIARDFMQEMQFPEDTAWTAIRHQDTDHDHIHIVACRISLSGGVWLGQWEVPRAIEATQTLEKRHGLTITKGLYDDEHKRRPADQTKKKASPAEENRAIRTGEGVPRLRLQALVEAAAQGQPTALQFAERLELAGVSVRANLASTGRLNGFSFEIDGVAMKGSDLGKAFTWKGLQAQGVSYEQSRDGAGLERFSVRAADASGAGNPAAPAEHDRVAEPAGAVGHANGADAGAVAEPAGADREQHQDGIGAAGDGATADRPDAAGSGQPAGSGGHGDGQRLEGAGDAAPGRDGSAESLRPGDGAPAAEPGRADGGDGEPSGAGIREQGAEPARAAGGAGRADEGLGERDQADGRDSKADRELAGPTERRDDQHGDRQREPDQGGAQRAAAAVEASGDGGSRGGASGGSRGHAAGDWASRFKRASAAKRRAEGAGELPGHVAQSHAEGARVDAADRHSARELDPSRYLESHGYEVVRDGTGGRHLSVRMGGDELYRLTRKHEGHWLWCDLYGNSGGDNIDLVREIEGTEGFAEAVYRLVSAPIQPVPVATPKPRTPPTLPVAGYGSKAAGRQYLEQRGIASEVIEAAEQVGMLRYAPGSLFFVGYDAQGTVQAATRRATDPTDDVQRRDLKGTDKRYPAILPGDPARVWIVEGGTDSLALHTIYRRRGEPVPTVIVSGGAGVRSFLEREEIQQMLRSAERVTLAYENEADAETQERTDTQHDAQAEAVRAITGRLPEMWRPRPEQGKDLADLNTYQLAVIEQRRTEQERAEAEAQRVARPDRGLEM